VSLLEAWSLPETHAREKGGSEGGVFESDRRPPSRITRIADLGDEVEKGNKLSNATCTCIKFFKLRKRMLCTVSTESGNDSFLKGREKSETAKKWNRHRVQGKI